MKPSCYPFVKICIFAVISLSIILYMIGGFIFPVHKLYFNGDVMAKGIKKIGDVEYDELTIRLRGNGSHLNGVLSVGNSKKSLHELTHQDVKVLFPTFRIDSNKVETSISGETSKGKHLTFLFQREVLHELMIVSTENSAITRTDETLSPRLLINGIDILNIPTHKQELIRVFGEPLKSDRESALGDL